MKIAIIGYGRMGKMIETIAQQRGHEIVCIIDVDSQWKFSSEEFSSADVAIEFTAPDVAFDNCKKAWAAGLKVVSGTTGWMEKHISEVEKQCYDNGKTLFWASNYSVGVAIFSSVNRHLAKIMNSFPQYEVSITETHHVHKLDHPSGTGITLAKQIVEAVDRVKGWQKGSLTKEDGTVVLPQTEDPDKMAIHSIRQGEVTGIHTVAYTSPDDSIVITHDAHSRSGLALGAVLAAEYALTHEGLLAISDMFDF